MIDVLPSCYSTHGFTCSFCSRDMFAFTRITLLPEDAFDEAGVLFLFCPHHEARLVVVQSEHRGALDDDTYSTKMYPLRRNMLFSFLRDALHCPDVTRADCDCLLHRHLSLPQLFSVAPSFAPQEHVFMSSYDDVLSAQEIPLVTLRSGQSLQDIFPRASFHALDSYRLMYWIRRGQYADISFSYDQPRYDVLKDPFSVQELADMGSSLDEVACLRYASF